MKVEATNSMTVICYCSVLSVMSMNTFLMQ